MLEASFDTTVALTRPIPLALSDYSWRISLCDRNTLGFAASNAGWWHLKIFGAFGQSTSHCHSGPAGVL
jgi:hypothetical protein